MKDTSAKLLHAQEHWRKANTQLRKLETHGDSLIAAIAFIGVIVSLTLLTPRELGTPLLIVMPLLLLTLPEWFGVAVKATKAGAESAVAKTALRMLFKKHSLQTDNPANNTGAPTSQHVQSVQLNKFIWLRENCAGTPVSLQIFAGQRVLITGDSGSGKSSLLLALAGLIANRGQVFVNDNIVPGERGQLFHYCAQTPLVLSDTLRFNLKIAQQDASDEELLAALDFACLAHLKSALDEWLGEQGRMLSGGEKKRLGLARAFLTRSPVWMLDEPFEGLDKNTHLQLIQHLDNIPTKPTKPIVFIVSHKHMEAQSFDHKINIESVSVI